MKKFLMLGFLLLIFTFGCLVEDDEFDEPTVDLLIKSSELLYQDVDDNGVPSLGDNFIVKIVVENDGYGKSDRCGLAVKLYRQGTSGTILENRWTIDLPALAPSEEKELGNLELDITKSGTYLVKSEIDYDDDVAEYDESNNEKEFNFQVSEAGGNCKGDVISIINYIGYNDEDYDGQISVGDRLQLVVLVKNIGTASVVATTLGIATYVDNILKQTIILNVPALAINQSESFDVEINAQYGNGNYAIVSQADYGEILNESDEINNQWIYSVVVNP